MSRSEAAAIFARLLSDKLDERIPSGNNVKFKDIDPDMWYAGYVEYLTGYGVAVGYNDRTYRGDKAITAPSLPLWRRGSLMCTAMEPRKSWSSTRALTM